MTITVLKRVIRAGFINFKRGGTISWAAILQMVNTLAIIGVIIFLQAVLSFTLSEIKDKVDVRIYLTIGAPEEKIEALQSSLEKLPEVASVEYASAEEVLKTFREKHKNDYPTIQALDELGENPFGGNLNIKAKEVGHYENIANFIKSDNVIALGSSSIIDHTDYYTNKPVIDRLNSIISGGQKLGFLVTLYLIISSIFITFNMIRLAIFISKEEISVMRLVGASKVQVRGPFMIEGAIYGVIATLITMFIFWPAAAWMGSNMTNFLGINLHSYYISNFFQIFAILLLSGIILGTISSFLAARKYLNK